MSQPSVDSNPSVYVVGHQDNLLKGFAERTAQNSAAYLLPHLRPHFSVLDVGCGEGSITQGLSKLIASNRTVGVDTSPEVVRRAIVKAKSINIGDHVTFREADAMALPFEDDSFDVVHAHQLLQHVPDARAVLAEMYRVVRPGGLVAVRVACAQTIVSAPHDEVSRFTAVALRAIASGGGDPDVARKLPGLARLIGFTSIETGSSMMSYVSNEERSLLAGMWRSAMKSEGMKKMLAEDSEGTSHNLEDLERVLNDLESDEDGFFLVPNVEILCKK